MAPFSGLGFQHLEVKAEGLGVCCLGSQGVELQVRHFLGV